MTLCEYVTDIAEYEAKKRLNNSLVSMICAISDEIIKTAVECDPEEEELDGIEAAN